MIFTFRHCFGEHIECVEHIVDRLKTEEGNGNAWATQSLQVSFLLLLCNSLLLPFVFFIYLFRLFIKHPQPV
jgi:hypothetical protein